MREIADVQSFTELVGQELGTSDWHTVTQLHVDAFARATEDYEELHVDPGSPLTQNYGGRTIAHGLYTLSMGPKLFEQILVVKKFRLGLNYGYDRVRFTAPVIPRCRLRLVAHLESAEPLEGNGLKLKIRQTFEIEGQQKPALVATWSVAYYD